MKPVSRRAIRLHVLIQFCLALVALVAINMLGFEFFVREDLSRTGKFALSEQTKRAIRDLQKELKITTYFSQSAVSPATLLARDVQNLLDEFVFSGRRKIRVEKIDPVRELGDAREAQQKYQFRTDENVLIMEYDGRTEILPIASMADFDFSAVPLGGPPRVLSFNGEQAITSAMINLVHPTQRDVYFLTGHGEAPPGDTSPVSRFIDFISKQNVTVHPLNLANVDRVPEDASAVMGIAPQGDYHPRERQLLDEYWARGGSLLFLLDPATPAPELDGLLTSWGIRPRGDRVLRTVELGAVTGVLREVTAEFFPKGPITGRLAGLSLFLPGETESLALDVPDGSDIAVRPLLQPYELFWGEVDYVFDESGGVRYDDGRDAGQPLFVGASASRGGVSDDRVQVESSKVVVVGSCQFALDAALSPSGLDFLVSATHWLLDRAQLSGTAPKRQLDFAFHLNEGQVGLLSLVVVILIPCACLLLAGFLALRRRLTQ